MVADHIVTAQKAWQPLTNVSRHWDNRLLSSPSEVTFTQPAEMMFEATPKEGCDHYIRPPHWNRKFEPAFSPMTMLSMGVFGGSYFAGALGRSRLALLPPYKGRSVVPFPYEAGRKDANYFKRYSGETRDWWLDKGLIYAEDPLGWFEWFCWYWLGRRIDNYDDWQIDRWQRFGGRFKASLRSRPSAAGYQQALLQWSHVPWHTTGGNYATGT